MAMNNAGAVKQLGKGNDGGFQLKQRQIEVNFEGSRAMRVRYRVNEEQERAEDSGLGDP